MRKTLSDRQEVAHYWANKVQSEGKAGNVFFIGDKIYSYGQHFCIARHVPGFVVFTTAGYSSSTNQHKSIVSSACAHIPRVYCNDPSGSAHNNKAAALRKVENALIASEKKGIRESTREKCKAQALQHAETFNAYLAALPKIERTEKPINTAKLDQFRAAMIRQAKREAKAREKAQIERAEKEREYLADWRSDLTMYTQNMRSLPAALRLNGDNVETSHGANIPVSDALRLWPVILRVKLGTKDYEPGMPIGAYRLTQIKTDGSIIVGCHNIAFSEIEAIAKKLGLLETEEACRNRERLSTEFADYL